MSNQETMKVLDELIIVQLDIRGSDLSGKVDRKTDLKSDALPPAALVSTGVRHFVDPALKRPFNTLKKQAERLCADAGFPLLRGWAVTRKDAKELETELRKIADKYDTAANDLETMLPVKYAEWESKPEHAEWVSMLRRDRPSPSEVRRRYRFRFRMYRVRGAGDDLDDALGIDAGGLSSAVLDDIGNTATEMLEKVFLGKAQVSKRVMPRIAAISTKLQGFAFIDPVLTPVARMIGEVLAKITPSNPLSTVDTSALRGLLQVLADPALVRRYGIEGLSITPVDTDQQHASTSDGLDDVRTEEQTDFVFEEATTPSTHEAPTASSVTPAAVLF